MKTEMLTALASSVLARTEKYVRYCSGCFDFLVRRNKEWTLVSFPPKTSQNSLGLGRLGFGQLDAARAFLSTEDVPGGWSK